MFLKTINKIKQRIKNNSFRTKIKEEKRKIFIDTLEEKDKFQKKRKQFTFKFPTIENDFVRENLKLTIFFFIIGIIIITIVSLFSPIFNIKKINIEVFDKGNNLIDLNISYNSIDYLRNKNIILVEKDEILEQLTNYQRNIIKIDIDKNIFDKTLNIKIGSSRAIFYTMIDGKKYIITENGVFVYSNSNLLKNLSEIKISLSEKNKEFIEYKKVLREDYLKKITKLKNDIEQNIIGLKVKSIYYFEDEREVHFDVNNNIKIIFDLNVDMDEQLRKVIVFSKEHKNLVKDNTINYIDLRILNKIYYCENEFVWSCKKNLKLIYNLYE